MSFNFGRVAASPSYFDLQITALNPPRAPQSLRERVEIGLAVGVTRVDVVEHAYAAHTILPPCRSRPDYRRAAQQPDDLPTSH
jgi:hypothetical protein